MKERPNHKLSKGQTVTLKISSLAPGGEGVSRDLAIPVFINRVAPNDVVEVELFDVRKTFAKGKISRILEASPQRVDPPCKLFKVCGGCQWQHLSYEAQAVAKQDILKQAVKHIGKLDPELVKPTIAAEQPLYYRNKVQFPVANPRGSKRILAGYYQQDSHELVNIKHCPVQPEMLDRMLEVVKQVCEKHSLPAYDERTGSGLLRHISARYSSSEKQILVTLVLNTTMTHLDSHLFCCIGDEIRSGLDTIVGVCVNLNTLRGNKIYGEETVIVSGQDHIEERLSSYRQDRTQKHKNGLVFRLGPTSFFQVNSAQALELLEVVLDAVIESKTKPLVIDAYAGVGTIALWLAEYCSRVIAIEEFTPAVVDGKINANINSVDNLEFRQGAVEDAFPELYAENVNPDVIVLDPPRKGVSQDVLEQVIKFKATRIVYVSCNPATLARDLQILEQNGYKTKAIQPLDMFPQTYHVESVTTLELSELK